MTYAQLLQQIQDMLEYEEADFIASIPDFVKRAEDDIYGQVQIPATSTVASGTVAPGAATFNAPSDFLAPYSLSMTAVTGGEGRNLEDKDREFLREIIHGYPDGFPRFYCVNEVNSSEIVSIRFAPVADVSYTYSLLYYKKLASLVTESTTWLSLNAPNAMFYGTLIHAYRYLKGEPDTMAEYVKGFEMAIANLRILAEGRMKKDTYRNPNQVPPT